ncbi:MAG: hypothetical protein JWR77_2521, partial [Rhizorhabdus sp.]|nr:hypothetical protein [Rhizorhabdus sp.]
MASRMLQSQPDLALAQAGKVLRALPNHPDAELIKGQALRRLGKPEAALLGLSALARRQPHMAAVIWELAQAASEAGDTRQAIAALETL